MPLRRETLSQQRERVHSEIPRCGARKLVRLSALVKDVDDRLEDRGMPFHAGHGVFGGFVVVVNRLPSFGTFPKRDVDESERLVSRAQVAMKVGLDESL